VGYVRPTGEMSQVPTVPFVGLTAKAVEGLLRQTNPIPGMVEFCPDRGGIGSQRARTSLSRGHREKRLTALLQSGCLPTPAQARPFLN